ncbi:hypothetical protein A7U60_g1009 [Sanghuangporus baumii]|uniref:Beta-xylanase n=1 Tax=Sanghuangporus baumii TaxID=108892 RepID=A0A9Q5I571_SANBA|nr:hypothetical protein A7U60_g1009 [Sanghuangporus baumii]
MTLMFSKRLSLLLLGVTACLAAPQDATIQGGGSRPIIIRNLARPRYFGTAANTTFLYNDQAYTQIISTQFSMMTPENDSMNFLKWENIEPQQNVFNFTGGDEIVRFAKSVNARVRGHTFEWQVYELLDSSSLSKRLIMKARGNQLAPWVNDSLTATQLDRALENHIKTVLNHYRGQLYAFDVINEMISDNTPNETFKDNIWTRKFGEIAMPKALQYARETDKNIKIYINDYGTEGINSKSDTLYSVVQGFIRDGVPVDGIGFQCHFYLGQVPTTIAENMQRFADLGLDVAVTEVDINMRGPENETALAQQAQDYWTIVNACVSTNRCVGVTIWGVSDDHSWLPNGNVLPWNAQKQPKPAFYAIADAFQGKPIPSPA